MTTNKGWICPVCGVGLAPWVQSCQCASPVTAGEAIERLKAVDRGIDRDAQFWELLRETPNMKATFEPDASKTLAERLESDLPELRPKVEIVSAERE